jgi:hypothetical protein
LNFERFRFEELPPLPVTVKLWESTYRAGAAPVDYPTSSEPKFMTVSVPFDIFPLSRKGLWPKDEEMKKGA